MLAKNSNGSLPNFWNDFFENDWLGTPNAMQAGTSIPAVNIKNTLDFYEIEMAVPGLEKEDFKINLDNNLLSIESEMRADSSNNNEEYTRREFSYSSFKRSFTLPETVDTNKISATYTVGVLHVIIPKKEEAKPKPVKMIEIK